MSVLLCLIAFALCYLAATRSLVAGLAALLAVGYAYGIVRANVPETYSHFIFDAGVVGIYGAQLFKRLNQVQLQRVSSLRIWIEVLIVWPFLVFFIPYQDVLVRLVGLRGNIFLVPFIIIGARMEDREKYDTALVLSVLNIAVFAFALVEFFVGIEQFFPRNEVTRLIYISKDVVGHTAYRIPSTFLTAHAYAGTMVMGLPFLLGALHQKNKQHRQKSLLITGVVTSLLGVLIAATRLHFIGGAILVLVAIFTLRLRFGHLLFWLLILAGIGWIVSGEQRLQRFTELQDTEMITARVAGSTNSEFVSLALSYPFGNGLGGGGTSMPYFLADRVEHPVVMENEFVRIMLEQGLVGLALWLVFIFWLLTRREPDRSDPWFLGRRLAWAMCALYFGCCLIGTGLFTAIPQTVLFMLGVGWIGARQPGQGVEEVLTHGRFELSRDIAC
jgi:hypothetical protein